MLCVSQNRVLKRAIFIHWFGASNCVRNQHFGAARHDSLQELKRKLFLKKKILKMSDYDLDSQ